MKSPQPQQQSQPLLAPMETTSENDEDYLQVLDAGEHMYDMFVASENEDLCAFLDDNDTTVDGTLSWWSIPDNINNMNIEEMISRSVTMQQQQQAMDDDLGCASCSFSKLNLGTTETNHNGSDDDSATNPGRLTPPTYDDFSDVMSE